MFRPIRRCFHAILVVALIWKGGKKICSYWRMCFVHFVLWVVVCDLVALDIILNFHEKSSLLNQPVCQCLHYKLMALARLTNKFTPFDFLTRPTIHTTTAMASRRQGWPQRQPTTSSSSTWPGSTPATTPSCTRAAPSAPTSLKVSPTAPSGTSSKEECRISSESLLRSPWKPCAIIPTIYFLSIGWLALW